MSLPTQLNVITTPEWVVSNVSEVARTCPGTVTVKATLEHHDGSAMRDGNYQIFWDVSAASVFFTYSGGVITLSSASGACTAAPVGDTLMWTERVYAAQYVPFGGSLGFQGWFGGTSDQAFSMAPCPVPPPSTVKPLRQYPRDDALGGAPRQRFSRSVQSSARQGWAGAYR
jgi:hypothetical protein